MIAICSRPGKQHSQWNPLIADLFEKGRMFAGFKYVECSYSGIEPIVELQLSVLAIHANVETVRSLTHLYDYSVLNDVVSHFRKGAPPTRTHESLFSGIVASH